MTNQNQPLRNLELTEDDFLEESSESSTDNNRRYDVFGDNTYRNPQSVFNELMANEPEILDEVPGIDGGDANAGRDCGGAGIVEGPIQTNGKLLSAAQRNYIGSLANRSFAAAQTSNGIILQDVILCGTNERAIECAAFIKRHTDSYIRSLLLISSHDNHVHVIHDCGSFARNGSCRCKWKKETTGQEGYEFRRRLQRQRRRGIRELNLSDWERIFLYFLTEGRHQEASYINGKIQTIPDEARSLAEQRLTRPRREESELAGHEEADLEGDPDDLRRLFKSGNSGAKDGRSSDELPRGTKRKREEDKTIFSGLLSILQRFPITPPENIVDHPVYLNSDMARYRGNNCKVQDALDVFSKKLLPWSLQDYWNEIYSKPDCNPIFSAGHTKFSDYYYDIDDSLDVLNKLLMYQFNNDEDLVYSFLETLYNVVERKIPKLNALLVHSPPSAGKNYFFDALFNYCLEYGQLSRANKNERFAYMDAYGKRIILFNEPNYESAETDMLKMITAGDAYKVRIKGKKDAAVYKTPIIFLTNNHINLMSNPAFKDRVVQYQWKAAPFLKDCQKYPNPLCIYHMFKNAGFIKV